MLHLKRRMTPAGVCLLALFGGLAAARGQSPWIHVYGVNEREYLGGDGRACIVDDLDRDGMAEVLLGIPSSMWPAVVRVVSGRDGTLLDTLSAGPNHARGFGTCVANAGDVDQDGVSDLLIGQPEVPSEGTVFVYSGRTRKLLYYLIGDVLVSRFGRSVAGAGDVDRDGYADLLIGAPESSRSLTWQGSVYIYSGGKQSLIRRLDGAERMQLGAAVASAGDVNGDGYPDQLIGAPGPAAGLSRAFVFSGKDGSVLYEWLDALAGKLGERVALAGDVDRDGYPDLAVGAPSANPAEQRGSVTLFSGRDGSVVRVIHGDSRGLQLGSSVAAAGDLDGDGHADVLVGGAGWGVGSTTFGVARVYSGKDGSVLFETRGTPEMKGLGAGVGSGGDVDGDGRMDFWVGIPEWGGSRQDYGLVRVYSARHLPLSTDRNTLSVAAGGTQAWQLDLRGQHGNQLYLVLGSTSGTTPGLNLGTVTLPLNPDPWFWFTATAANNPPLAGSIGFLSTQGRAAAGFTLPRQSDAGLVGLRLHHAFLVFGRGLDRLDFASNAVPLTLIQ